MKKSNEPVLVAWNSTFELGIPEIDSQHRKLIDIMNEFYRYVRLAKTSEVIEKILRQLVDYTQQHFKTEESLFPGSDLPEIQEHLRHHHDFKEQISRFYQRYIFEGKVSIEEMEEFFKTWVCRHILEQDKKYIEVLREKYGPDLKF